MARTEVRTEELHDGGAQQRLVAAGMTELAGVVGQAAASVAGAAGHAGAGSAAESWGPAWGAALHRHAGDVHGTATNLQAAADAYRETDEGQMRT